MAATISNTALGVMGNLRYFTGQWVFDGGTTEGFVDTQLTVITDANLNYKSGTAGTLSPAYSVPDPTKPFEVKIKADANSTGTFTIWGR